MAVTTILARIPLDAIRVTDLRTSWRTTSRLAPGAMKEITQCVSARGWLQAVTVRELGNSEYELIDGERRLAAARETGEAAIDALVVDADDTMAATIALLANAGTKDLRPIEKALACARVRDALSAAGSSATQEAVGQWVGLSQSTVNQYLRIAEAFGVDTLGPFKLSHHDLATYPASVLGAVARLPAVERAAWLEGVGEGSVSGVAGSPSRAGAVVQRVRQLKDACYQQDTVPDAEDSVAALRELLPVVGVLATQAATAGAAAVAGAVQRRLPSSPDYRSPIIPLLRVVACVHVAQTRASTILQAAFAQLAAKVRAWLATYLTLTALALGPAPTEVRGRALRQTKDVPVPAHGPAVRGHARGPPA